MSLDPALRARIDTLLADNRVVLFMKGHPRAPQCGFSAKAVGALNSLGVDLRARRRAGRPRNPRRHQGLRRLADDPAAVHRRRTGRRQRHHRADGRTRANCTARSACPPPDRTPPAIDITPAAPCRCCARRSPMPAATSSCSMDIDPQFRTRLHLAQPDANAITAEADGIRVQFDLAGARRARRPAHRLGRRRARPRPGHRESECTAAGERLTLAEAAANAARPAR